MVTKSNSCWEEGSVITLFVHLGCSSLSLKELSSSAAASCMGWETLSNSDVIFARVFLSPTNCTGSMGPRGVHLITSHFDCCNAGLDQSSVHQLLVVKNAAGRLLTSTKNMNTYCISNHGFSPLAVLELILRFY
ncbi:hypothetical protein ILYODFUR_028611 [Ilyodon furcidens]|uniref:Uncharacterized protein n=1 Tax=Ilyodon furcidens TaxID=33524 RepID=A0ABV0UL99_9TELE